MMVLVVYEPDEDCLDPLDPHATPRRHAHVISDDVLVVWREPVGDQDSDGHVDTHVASMGVFQNVTPREVQKALRKLGIT